MGNIKFAAVFVFIAWGFMFPKSHKWVFRSMWADRPSSRIAAKK